MKFVIGGVCAMVLATAARLETRDAGSACADLARLKLSNGTITAAENVDAGAKVSRFGHLVTVS